MNSMQKLFECATDEDTLARLKNWASANITQMGNTVSISKREYTRLSKESLDDLIRHRRTQAMFEIAKKLLELELVEIEADSWDVPAAIQQDRLRIFVVKP